MNKDRKWLKEQEIIYQESKVIDMPETREDKIFNRLHNDFNYVNSLGYTVLGVFLQGSQNYRLDYSDSDIDTKVIVVPKFKDFVLNKHPVSTTLILPSNEHIDLKDIRLYMDCFKKQNINFIEILFTEYKLINLEYLSAFAPMLENNERIAHYNNYKAVNSIAGIVYEKRKALCHPYPTLMTKIEKYGYDNKQLHHIIRCKEFLERYINGVPYTDCLIPTDPEYLINIKSNYIYSLDEAIQIADEMDAAVKEIKQRYMDTHDIQVDHGVEDIMNSVLYDVLKYSFSKEIQNDTT